MVEDGDEPPEPDGVTMAEPDMVNDVEAVGPAVLVELDSGKEAQVVAVEVVVDWWCAGQSVTVGWHEVMVTVLVRVWVDVVVVSASWAETRDRPVAARMVMMLLNCILSCFLCCRFGSETVGYKSGGEKFNKWSFWFYSKECRACAGCVVVC